MRKLLRALLSVGVVALMSHAAVAATYTVDSQTDQVDAKPGDGKCATDLGTCTLRAAIQEANEVGGGTINLNAGTYTLSIAPNNALPLAATGDLDLYGQLSINGGGADNTIVDGGGIARVFAVQVAARVDMSDLTIRNGKGLPGDDGGGVVNYGNLSMEDVTVTGNATRSDATLSADAPGGGIFNAATLQLRNCKVTGNTAADMGGGIHNKGIMTVLQSTISGNTATTDRGGGISNFNKATIVFSTISGNTATGAGGGIENGGGMTLTHSTVSGNTGELGGGIHNVGGLDMTDATIAGNTAGSKGGGTPAGGGIANKKPGTVQLANSIVAGNSDPGGKAPDCRGKLMSAGYNLVQKLDGCKVLGTTTGNVSDKDAKLGPLANNGGPTQTMALLAGSPAIDAGNPAKPGSGNGACELTDQRGTARPVNGAGQSVCDIGAFEFSK